MTEVMSRIIRSQDIAETVITDYISLQCDLDLKDSNQFGVLSMTLWHMMMHQHRFSCSVEIIRTMDKHLIF